MKPQAGASANASGMRNLQCRTAHTGSCRPILNHPSEILPFRRDTTGEAVFCRLVRFFGSVQRRWDPTCQFNFLAGPRLDGASTWPLASRL